MRLHSLQVSAFGPFAGTEQVDFDTLGADGLFLLHGETGAGKTTVLDAVAFALFGRVPGARSEAKRLLSDHAAPGARPEVTLELTVGGRRMRIVRSPEYQRPKRRGTGSTKEQAKASLTWVDEPGSEGLTRLDEIGAAVSDLLGMSAEQFFQVVLLPQGEFARFLRASTEERATLLQRLFDTGRFGDVEAWFREERRTSAARVAQSEAARTVLLGKLATAAGVDDAEPGAEQDPQEWAAELLHAAETAAVQGDVDLEAARVAAKKASTALSEARERAALLQRRRRAQGELAALEADRPRLQVLDQELSAARKAHPVQLAVADAEEARARARTLAAEVTQLSETVRNDVDGACGLEAELGDSLAQWRAEIGRLTELVDLAERTEADVAALAGLRTEIDTATAALEQLRQQLEALPGAIETAEQHLGQTRRAADAVPALAAQRTRAAEAAQAAGTLEKVRLQAAEARQAQLHAIEAHQEAKQDWLNLRERRLDGMAAELASTLLPGEPCAVCGSAEHPAPATAGEQRVTRAEEDAAHQVEQRAAATAEAATGALHELDRTVDSLTVRTGGVALEELLATQAEIDAEHARTQALADEADTAAQLLTALRAERGRLDAEAATVRSAIDTHRERVRATEERIAAAKVRLSDACGPDADVHTRRVRLQRLAEAAEALLSAQVAARAAERLAEQAQAKAERAAADAGLGELTTALAAVRSDAEVRALEEQLQQARGAEAAACAVLAEPEVAAVADAEVDLDTPQQTCETAEAALAQATGAAADASRRRTEVRRLQTELDQHCAALGPELARHAELAALADVVNGLGQNSRRVSLHSYVLAARLEEVAAVASVRLRRMSGDRYEFVHSDAPGSRGTRGGLGLDIRDDYTGAVRSAKTLSGGESFLASLALALGLAEVVAAEAGGILLDTLFIDEGFGSLDASTLEEVMAVLDELRAGGRVVGLVSHVDELRQRIPNRLLVCKGRTGSHLQMSSA
ncbi:SMC family ATPase [Rhodococcus sp. X156]|uniref:AAA family ATPase n=1 Tax=Rhodococcus sp. X156 TaxID=2499145 RepID=UPI000FDAD6B1|nr:SMC family ATPase [Rhodococcus sp. X156]